MAKQQLLRLDRTRRIDRDLAFCRPARKSLRHIGEECALQFAALEASLPYLALQALQRRRFAIAVHQPDR